jgi:pimeloyl-ACP methyl ester carboxylesterase
VDQHVDVAGDDAYPLLAEVTSEPAYVFGTSAGALVGIELAIRHPEQVKVLVAHEPPVIDVLPDSAEWRKFFDEVLEKFWTEGASSAVGKFVEMVGVDPESQAQAQAEQTPEFLAMMGQLQKNLSFFAARLGRERGRDFGQRDRLHPPNVTNRPFGRVDQCTPLRNLAAISTAGPDELEASIITANATSPR